MALTTREYWAENIKTEKEVNSAVLVLVLSLYMACVLRHSVDTR